MVERDQLMAVGASLGNGGGFIATRESLLSKIREPENERWQEFFETYWKLIYNSARQCGLSDTEAQEVVQETMIGVSRQIPNFQYEPARCSFKSWLMQLIRWRIIDQIRQRGGHEQLEAAANVPDETRFAERWEEDWERNFIDAAVERVKRRVNPRDFQIFSFCTLQRKGSQETAKVLDVTLARVYMARHRISREIAREVARLKQRNGTPR